MLFVDLNIFRQFLVAREAVLGGDLVMAMKVKILAFSSEAVLAAGLPMNFQTLMWQTWDLFKLSESASFCSGL